MDRIDFRFWGVLGMFALTVLGVVGFGVDCEKAKMVHPYHTHALPGIAGGQPCYVENCPRLLAEAQNEAPR